MSTLQNLVICLKEREEAAAIHGGDYWPAQVRELKAAIKQQLLYLSKKAASYSKISTAFKPGDTILDSGLCLVLGTTETAKMVRFEAITAAGEYVAFKRNKSTYCNY